MITYATGQKPLIAASRAAAARGVRGPHRGPAPLVVGDRLDTDIEAAQRVDADSLLVLTGVTGPAEAVLAPANQRPTYLADGLSGLVEAQPEVSSGPGGFGCGGWTARWTDDGELDLSGQGAGSTACAPCAPPPGPVTAPPRTTSPRPENPGRLRFLTGAARLSGSAGYSRLNRCM